METEALLDALAADTLVPWKHERSIQLALIVGNIIAGMMFFGGIWFPSRHRVRTGNHPLPS
jgi:hypothetical protein